MKRFPEGKWKEYEIFYLTFYRRVKEPNYMPVEEGADES